VPYFLSTHLILAPEGTDITNAQDLVSKTVVVRNGTTGAVAVESVFGATVQILYASLPQLRRSKL